MLKIRSKNYSFKKEEVEYNTQSWCKNGKYHRENGPAVIDFEYYQYWILEGKIQRSIYLSRGEICEDNGPFGEVTDVE